MTPPDAIELQATESEVVEHLVRVAGHLDVLQEARGDEALHVIAASQAVHFAIVELESA